MNLTDIVEQGTGQNQIRINLGIERCHFQGQAGDPEGMFQKAAEPGVMHRLGRRSQGESLDELLILDKKGFAQPPQPGIPDIGNNMMQITL